MEKKPTLFPAKKNFTRYQNTSEKSPQFCNFKSSSSVFWIKFREISSLPQCKESAIWKLAVEILATHTSLQGCSKTNPSFQCTYLVWCFQECSFYAYMDWKAGGPSHKILLRELMFFLNVTLKKTWSGFLIRTIQ